MAGQRIAQVNGEPLFRPFIVGLGGTVRAHSTSEMALRTSLAAARACGADTLLLSGCDLAMPIYDYGTIRGAEAERLISSLRRCHGVIISTPAYHGSLSGLLKNALDYVEDLRTDERVYWDGIAVGCVVCAGGWHAAGQALTTVRSIVHALRGWPTPLGVMINASLKPFDESGNCADASVKSQLETVGRQVVEFAVMRQLLKADLETSEFSVLSPAAVSSRVALPR